MSYFVSPQGTPSHTNRLEARLDSITVPPYIPSGLTIEWRQDGATIKSGSTDVASNLYVNSGDLSDFNFDATDTGSVIDFIIDSVTFSNPVILSNIPPVASSIVVQSDVYGISPINPTITWTYSDADNDKQFVYRVKLGTTVGGSDLYDSGFVYYNPGDANRDNVTNSNDVSYINGLLGLQYFDTGFDYKADLNRDGVIDSLDAAIATAYQGKTYTGLSTQSYSHQTTLSYGQSFNWTLEIGDGEKTNPTDPDYPEPSRVLVSYQGTGKTNTIPVVSNITIDGTSGGSNIGRKTPVIGWIYSDVDSQPQYSFRVKVSSDSSFFNVLWDSGVITSNLNTVSYNYNSTGTGLSSHTIYYVSVVANDGINDSTTTTDSFIISSDPSIIVCTVEDKVNPLNLKSRTPTFTWQYTDIDLDPLAIYDIRIADNNTDWGTDSFVGNIWHPGRITTPESYQTKFNFDGTAFGSCLFPNYLQTGTTYYFQLQVLDTYGGMSGWYTGFFRLNNAPTVINLAVLPTQPFTNDDLEAFYTFVDDPGEFESPLTEIRWYKDGTEVVFLRNIKLVPSSNTSPGEQWFFTVRPSDGVDYGSIYTSPIVVISNRPPQVTILGINPENPETNDNLTASWITSDPDGDDVTVTIQWFKNGNEQFTLRNSPVVPAGMTSAGDVWFFGITPNDGFDDGQFARSADVTIANTPPRILSISVDGQIVPNQLDNPNPKFAWKYFDLDGDSQSFFQIVMGTRPLKVSNGSTSNSNNIIKTGGDGITQILRSDTTIISGNDILDTGPINSPQNTYQYITKDYMPPVSLGPANVERYFNYGLQSDLVTMSMNQSKAVGDVSFIFPGVAGIYQIQIQYVLNKTKSSSYRLIVDGVPIDSFASDRGTGTLNRTFKPCMIDTNSRVVIVGSAIDSGATADFRSLTCSQLSIFDIRPSSMVLSGYSGQDDGSIRLSALAGTATIPFGFPSGTYDIEFHYVTETSGNPTAVMTVNNNTVLSLTYESGARNRVNIISGIDINTGDTIKITGTKNGNATARVSELIFRPVQTSKLGSKLEDGLVYYISIRVSDGTDWSNWYGTKFFMAGSAWVSSVNNATGWTIETRFRVIPSG